MKKWFSLLAAAMSLLAACTGSTTYVEEFPEIYPDYIGVTIPAGIAFGWLDLVWVLLFKKLFLQ